MAVALLQFDLGSGFNKAFSDTGTCNRLLHLLHLLQGQMERIQSAAGKPRCRTINGNPRRLQEIVKRATATLIVCCKTCRRQPD